MATKERYAMTIEELQGLRNDDTFHHATYRDRGTLWEGLHIYVKDQGGFRGYRHHGSFPKDDPDLSQAFKIVQGTGVSVGAYGRG